MNNPIVSQNLFNIFRLYSSRNFIFLEPGGNFGDSIIYQGAYKLASQANLLYEKVNFKEFMNAEYSPETVIYIHGGGGINNFWSGKPIKALKKALSQHKGIVILGPQTFQIHDNFLHHFLKEILNQVAAEKAYLFCREIVSYEQLRNHIPANIDIFLDHDTALNLTKQDFHLKQTKGSYVLYCMRSDKELNASQEYNFLSRWIDPITSSHSFDEWLNLHAGAKEIITNRLHSAIIGTILEIPVTLLPNNYHKNRAIWEFSLRSRNVKWKEFIPVGYLSRQLSHIDFIKKFRQSKLCQRMIHKLSV